MNADPIVKQVRAAREAYAKRFGFDLRRIAADLMQKQDPKGVSQTKASGAKPPKRRRKAA